ncbi:uncharacterized protein PHACADRAFT_187325 [Phanerochaete carnosa HHB-10118-sp]|uniref:CNH domain-containing protein n=1 Tax=Phanerochaete carnosa (strain HHB-10118-sp) TaxID=650164 RepID=K5VYP2_PHACS|nr:uncharacterized protein PHACADRAFT_187325 [Phanerochaete carnosa HHB-10118-sp]EKM51935.1 hypothetical protein PHACADRAFT_187325 [Phanerochaete carnosa HHB-10118-sp]
MVGNTYELMSIGSQPIPLEFLAVSTLGTPQELSRMTTTLKRISCVIRTPSVEADQGSPGWIQRVQKQQEVMQNRLHTFNSQHLSLGGEAVSCVVPFDQGRNIVYGATDGVYLLDVTKPHNQPSRILALSDVTQVDDLEECQILIVLSGGQVLAFPLDVLDLKDPIAALERVKRVASQVSFFKAGTCLGRTMLCTVESSLLSSTIKIFEPVSDKTTEFAKFRRRLQGGQHGGNDGLAMPIKGFRVARRANAVMFLKTRICLSCTDDFKIVDIESLDNQPLLAPSDQSLDFVRGRKALQAIALYRVGDNFLVCYDEFAFYVNRTGCRSNKHFLVFWEGTPTAFATALQYPYILAFDPTFVEIWHVETGRIVQVIQGSNIRCLFTADTPPSLKIDPANPSAGRSEMLIVSDERVMKLRVSAETL